MSERHQTLKRSLVTFEISNWGQFRGKTLSITDPTSQSSAGSDCSGGGGYDVVRICATSVEDGAHPHCDRRPLHAAHS